MNIKIRSPIWKSRAVGIAERHLLGSGDIFVEILYKNIDKVRIYPGIYTMSKAKARLYPKQVVKGVILFIIPILEFDKKEK